ncbi:MAG: carbohydrate ABC transporter permease [Candidatus Enteromonas sp.]
MAYDNRNFIQKLLKMPTAAEKQAAREAKPEYQAIKTSGMTLTIKDRAKNADQLAKAQKVGRILWLVVVYAFLLFMALIVLFPFYWMVITSLKSTTEIRSLNQTFFPTHVLWSNYITVFNSFDFGTYVGNTLVVGVISTLGTLLTTIFAAFAFARLNFKGREAIFGILLATMMIPGEMMVITNYITVSRLPWFEFANGGVQMIDGWLTTKSAVFAAMIVPFWVSVFYIYLLRQNFKQIPNELYLAAKVDGKSDWQYLWKVMVPLASPTLISIFILKLMGAWNSYVWPNLVTTNDPSWRLVTNALRGSFTNSSGEPQYGIQMAATILVTVPLLLLFIFFRKYIMRGVGRAGIKG